MPIGCDLTKTQSWTLNGEGGGTRNGSWEAFRRPSGSPGQGDRRGEGEQGDHENTLPLVGRESVIWADRGGQPAPMGRTANERQTDGEKAREGGRDAWEI